MNLNLTLSEHFNSKINQQFKLFAYAGIKLTLQRIELDWIVSAKTSQTSIQWIELNAIAPVLSIVLQELI